MSSPIGCIPSAAHSSSKKAELSRFESEGSHMNMMGGAVITPKADSPKAENIPVAETVRCHSCSEDVVMTPGLLRSIANAQVIPRYVFCVACGKEYVKQQSQQNRGVAK